MGDGAHDKRAFVTMRPMPRPRSFNRTLSILFPEAPKHSIRSR